MPKTPPNVGLGANRRLTRRRTVHATILGVVAAACISDDLPGVPRIGTSPGKVIYATWGAPGTRESEHWTLLSFEKNYTDLRVDVVIAAESERGYMDRLQAMVAGGSDPDVMRLAGPDAPHFYASAVTKKLDPLMRRDGVKTDGFAGPFDGATFAKSWHAFPRGRTSLWGVFFDRDRFARAGLADPDPRWTWESLVDVAKRLTVQDADQWGLSIDPLTAFPVPWIWGAGADDLDQSGVLPQWDLPPVREALEWIHGLRHVHRVAPPTARHAGVGEMAAGRVAMWFGCADDEFALRRAGSRNFGFAPQPRGRVSQSAAWHPDVVAIGARAPNPDEAWEFLQYLVDPDTQRLEFDQGLWLPQAKSITDDASYRTPQAPPGDRRGSIAGALVKPRSPILGPSSGAARRASLDALADYWRGKSSLDAATTRANEAMRAVLER